NSPNDPDEVKRLKLSPATSYIFRKPFVGKLERQISHIVPETASVEEAAAAVAAAPAAAEEEEQKCDICYDVLSAKRAIVCIPCMHAMHRTCAILWFESRT
ncbi:hypothetical protein PMAYCL1PPCAC_10892, partial [Pristionchus mayeri]